jgi:hypothetical protein
MAGILASWLGIQAAFLVFVPLYALLAAAMLWRTRFLRSEDIGRRPASSVLVGEV